MKIGFNLLLWTAHVQREHWPILENLKRTGYDGVEIPVFEGEPAHYAELGRHLKQLGLETTAIALFPSLDVNPIGDTPEQRAAGIAHSAAAGRGALCEFILTNPSVCETIQLLHSLPLMAWPSGR